MKFVIERCRPWVWVPTWIKMTINIAMPRRTSTQSSRTILDLVATPSRFAKLVGREFQFSELGIVIWRYGCEEVETLISIARTAKFKQTGSLDCVNSCLVDSKRTNACCICNPQRPFVNEFFYTTGYSRIVAAYGEPATNLLNSRAMKVLRNSLPHARFWIL